MYSRERGNFIECNLSKICFQFAACLLQQEDWEKKEHQLLKSTYIFERMPDGEGLQNIDYM